MASPATRSLVARWLPVALFALAAAGGGLALALREPGPMPAPASVLAPTPAVMPSPARAPAPAPKPPAPSFDVVRIAPDGSAVIAGRAAPGATVTLREGGKEIGQAQADQQGAFVIVPATKLPPGSAELTLSAKPQGGGAERAGTGAVVLAVPKREGSTKPLAVLVGPGASRPLQAPGTATAGHLGLGTLDYDQHGAAQFAGTAPPGAHVRVYVDNHPAGEATAGPDGRWTLTPTAPLAAGHHQLRLDQLGADGRVARRIELPFMREKLAGRDIPPGSVMVQPGDSLWRIARASYGEGIRYVVIFQANHAQIRKPDLIYPGQVFRIPSPLEQAK